VHRVSISGAPVRTAIVSRQEVVARGLTAMLADHPERVAVTALPSVRSEARGVDVIVYDVHGLLNADGSELEHLVGHTGARILVLSRDMRPDLRARALAMGCRSWVSMSIRSGDLVDAIERTAAGEVLAEKGDRSSWEQGLSPREVEVLALITQGLSNADIATRLYLSENTLKSHIRSAYRKIGSASRSQAVAWAIQHGFSSSHA